MSCWIEKTPDGKDCIFCDSADVGCDNQTQALPAEQILIRASDGHVFKAPPGLKGLFRLAPHDVAMVEYWLRERGVEIGPNIFAGDPVG